MPLDIGIGILFAIGVSYIFAIPLTVGLVAFAIACALLPDIDIITALFGEWKHRTYTHYPILYIPIWILGYIIFPLPYATLLLTGVLAHLVHDTIGTGWGIAWLWPFTNRRFLLLPDGERRAQMGAAVSWIPEEQPQYAHVPGNTSWVKRLYFTRNIVAYIEYGVLLVSSIALFLYIYR